MLKRFDFWVSTRGCGTKVGCLRFSFGFGWLRLMIRGGLGCLAVWRSRATGVWVLLVLGVTACLMGFRCGFGHLLDLWE
jgi:hypothetical protein